MSTPMDINGEKAAKERRDKRFVKGFKWSLFAVTVLMVIPMTAVLASTIIMTPILLVVGRMTRSYGDLWASGWVISAITLYACMAYLMIAYRINQRR